MRGKMRLCVSRSFGGSGQAKRSLATNLAAPIHHVGAQHVLRALSDWCALVSQRVVEE